MGKTKVMTNMQAGLSICLFIILLAFAFTVGGYSKTLKELESTQLVLEKQIAKNAHMEEFMGIEFHRLCRMEGYEGIYLALEDEMGSGGDIKSIEIFSECINERFNCKNVGVRT